MNPNETSREKVVDLTLGRTLKTLGFNYPTYTYQVDANNGAIISGDVFNHNLNPHRVALPSYALVLQWLSEEKGIDVTVRPAYTGEGREFTYTIYTEEYPDGSEFGEHFADRDDAMLYGILKVLKQIM